MTSTARRPSRRTAFDPVVPCSDTTTRHVMPAEWMPHRATWIAWPHNRTDWPGKLGTVRWWYVELVRHLAAVEPVAICFRSNAEARQATARLEKAGVSRDRIEPFVIQTNRCWVRDSGGTFVLSQGPAGRRPALTLVDWHFNAWARYDDWSSDDEIPTHIAAALQRRRLTPHVSPGGRRIVLEGGSIDVNGAGVALATEQCLLDQTIQPRNPGLGRAGMEEALRAYLGIDTVIWLGAGIAGDDTHGHVDDIARFVAPRTVVAAIEPDERDANFRPLADNLERLCAARVGGHALTVITVPMPRPLWFGGQRLPASYLNFYIANDLVLVPTYNDPADRVALDTLANLFPTREVVGLHAVDLVLGLGTVHCVTLQEPAA